MSCTVRYNDSSRPFWQLGTFCSIAIGAYRGQFPFVAHSTDQAILLPVSEKHEKYAKKVLNSLENQRNSRPH